MNSFYHPQLNSQDHIIEIKGDEARHIKGSKRLKTGEQICLFNGHGLVVDAEISEISYKTVTVNVLNHHQATPPKQNIILASALPKGDRINTLLDMATQLGMTTFIPLVCEHSIVKFANSKIERYERICISACKQSQRFFIPRISSSQSLSSLLANYSHQDTNFLVADPTGQRLNAQTLQAYCCNLILVIGPEGGFSSSELGLMREHEVNFIKLSSTILRIETAGVALLSQINHRQIG